MNLNEFLNEFLIELKTIVIYQLCFDETRLAKEIAPLFRVPGYTLLSNPRNTHGGGVVFMFKCSLSNYAVRTVFVANRN